MHREAYIFIINDEIIKYKRINYGNIYQKNKLVWKEKDKEMSRPGSEHVSQ